MGMDRDDRGTIEQHIWRLDRLLDEIDELDKETIKERITKMIYGEGEWFNWFGMSVLMTK